MTSTAGQSYQSLLFAHAKNPEKVKNPESKTKSDTNNILDACTFTFDKQVLQWRKKNQTQIFFLLYSFFAYLFSEIFVLV